MLAQRRLQLDVKLGPVVRRGPPDLLQSIVDNLYSVIDRRWETYCILVSNVVAAALHRLGVEAEVIPCQLVHIGGPRYDVIGFSGRCLPDQWDGHVVVRVGQFVIDGAVAGLRHHAGRNVPAAVLARCLPIPSSILARHDLGGDRQLLWLAPPDGADTAPPLQPEDLICTLSERLVARLAARRPNSL
jgi:hypothetical protein